MYIHQNTLQLKCHISAGLFTGKSQENKGIVFNEGLKSCKNLDQRLKIKYIREKQTYGKSDYRWHPFVARVIEKNGFEKIK